MTTPEEEQEVNNTISAVMPPDEALQLSLLATSLGVSTSHLGRALIRKGLQSVYSSTNKDRALLKLIKLGE